MESAPLLSLSGVVKRYPGRLANDRVSLTVGPGRIHALLGENGAGKSTLVKIVYGALQPDAGFIEWDGRRVAIASPAHARRLGIGMVHQHFSLFEALSVADNVSLALNDPADRADLTARIAAVSAEYGLPVDPARTVHDLSAGERQRVEIVRCLLQRPRLLIMDEPTSVLTPQEADRLFLTLRRLAGEGCAVLYISHKLEEVRALCDDATALRQGRVVGSCAPSEHSARALAAMMIGAELAAPARSAAAAPGAPRLVLSRLTVRSPHVLGVDLKGIDLSVAGGRILGVAGIAGNGQSELLDSVSGEILAGRPENVLIDGAPAGLMGPSERRALGGCFVPEDRQGHGAVPSMSLSENAFLSAHMRGSLTRLGMIDEGRTGAFARAIIAEFDVRTTGASAEARSLSGGNLQKFLVGREVLLEPNVLAIAQPTWGVDAGAAQAIHAAIVRLARAGAAVLVISQDLEELFALCDDICVLAAGRLSAPVPAASATSSQIGLLMGGDAALA